MTPNQKHEQKEYETFMPKLKEARTVAAYFEAAKTPDDIVKAFASLGYVARTFLDEWIKDAEEKHTERMSRSY